MLLAIDSATATASLAVYDLDKKQLLAELTWQARRRQTQDLLVMARQLLAQLELTPQDLTALAVTTGPGSFTGVRIGISAVKGIAMGLPTLPPIIGVPTLVVTAAAWLEVAQSVANLRVYAYIQAGRGRYHWAWLSQANLLSGLAVEDHTTGTVDELVSVLTNEQKSAGAQSIVWLVGEPTTELMEGVQSLPHVICLSEVAAWRRTGYLAQVAAARMTAGLVDSVESLQPVYLRAP